MKRNSNIEDLYFPFREIIKKALEACHKKGLQLHLFEGVRSYERSNWLYAQGRTKEQLNSVGLIDVEPRAGNRITNAYGGKSKHNFSIAADLVFDGDEDREGIQWTWEGQYDYAARIIKKVDPQLQWGGDWSSFKDKPHFQLKQPYSMAQLNVFYQAGGLERVFLQLDKHFVKPVQIVVPELTIKVEEIGKANIVKVVKPIKKSITWWQKFKQWFLNIFK